MKNLLNAPLALDVTTGKPAPGFGNEGGWTSGNVC